MDNPALRAALQARGLSREDLLLIILLAVGGGPFSVRSIREMAVAHGVRASKWNISSILKRAKDRAVLVPEGWRLGVAGRTYLANRGISLDAGAVEQAISLRKLLPKIASEKNRHFVTEAVSSYEHRNLRAAVVLSWVGAVSILYDHVVQNALGEFNLALTRRNSQKRMRVKNSDDLADFKEDTFLDVLHEISIIGKSEKDELKACLKFRNGCGHPNSLVVGETRVAAHLETLINNVYHRF